MGCYADSFDSCHRQGRRERHTVDHSDYGSGTLGECLDVLLYEDPNVVLKLHITIKLLLEAPDITQAVRAASLALTHSRDQSQQLNLLIGAYPSLLDHEWFQALAACIREGGSLSLY